MALHSRCSVRAGRIALFSTASEFHAGAPLEGGWQLSDGFSPLSFALSCADDDPINIRVAAAVSTKNLVIAKTSLKSGCETHVFPQT